MASGDQILGECSGRITATRVLAPQEGQQVKVEVSLEGRGRLLGEGVADFGTCWQTVGPGGVLYGEGDNLWLTDDGENVVWRGFGVGRPHWAAARGASCRLRFGTDGVPGPLARLDSVANVVEYDVDAEGNYRWTLWEWK